MHNSACSSIWELRMHRATSAFAAAHQDRDRLSGSDGWPAGSLHVSGPPARRHHKLMPSSLLPAWVLLRLTIREHHMCHALVGAPVLLVALGILQKGLDGRNNQHKGQSCSGAEAAERGHRVPP